MLLKKELKEKAKELETLLLEISGIFGPVVRMSVKILLKAIRFVHGLAESYVEERKLKAKEKLLAIDIDEKEEPKVIEADEVAENVKVEDII